MSTLIIAMVIGSALIHATWNALLKGDGDKAAAWWLLSSTMAVCALIHGTVIGVDFSSVLVYWPYVLASLVGQVIYGVGLIATYRRGDMSAYYPIIRSTPIFVVIVGIAVLGRSYDAIMIGGIALVVVGAFLLQYRPGVRLLDHPAALGFSLLALSGTGIYSLADAHAMQHLEPQVMLFAVELLLMPTYLIVFQLNGSGNVAPRAWQILKRAPITAMGGGALAYLSYWLILTAYQAGGDVAAVSAIRQISIPFAVLIGGTLLREAGLTRRLAASLLLVAGIVVVIVYG